jgi:peptidoglycan/xylan/chitin deacetylase (PgdA/CDA1 family)
MNLYNAPWWLRIIYPKGLVWRIPVIQKELFLTFDDGPVPEVTPLVLEILRKKNVKATFFLVGDNVQKYPEIYDAITKEGHVCGNHTFHHVKAWETGYPEYLSEVEQCQKYINTNLFRPPHGQINRRIACSLRKNHKIIMWSTLTGDYNTKLNGNECLKLAIRNTFPGAIIVFHDSTRARERLEYALPLYIEYCLTNGYIFKTLA